MKTLDEVIDQLIDCHTNWARWSQTSDIVDRSTVEDAIEYLKGYREKHDDILRMEEALGYCEIMDNPPLTWNELKTMIGKPVWVEDNIETPEDITKYWAIMWKIEKAEGDEYALLSDFYYPKSEYKKDWIAYRKERS